jgi:hypothetical protein
MPESEIEFQREKLFMERLYKQLQTVEEFRFKFTITKITFVIGLLGIGTMKLNIGRDVDLSAALYLAPLVAVLFDILGMAATLAIYRINAFLGRERKPNEEKWQTFTKKYPLSFSQEDWSFCLHPNKSIFDELSFYYWAANGFTLITFVASFIARPDCKSALVLLFILAFLVFFRCLESKTKSALGHRE